MARDRRERMRVLLAGGGTGGHVFPALAVARELERRGCQLMWTGRQEGMERELVGEHGIDYRPLPSLPWVGKGTVARVKALLTLGVSALAARRMVTEAGVTVTVGTGGYVSAPAIAGSRLARRPVVLLEPNARAGTANRWLSRISSAACTGYEDTGKELACRSYWTGIPVRSEFFAARKKEGESHVLLVVGGSQGAHQINRLMPGVVALLAQKLERLTVIHQAGRLNMEKVGAAYLEVPTDTVTIRVEPFIDDMAAAMLGADLIVSRAGAMTLAEIAAAGVPSVLLPLAAAGGHQRENARQLEAAGAAEVFESQDVGAEELAGVVGSLLLDEDRRLGMAAAARALARRDAVERIADVVQVLGRAA
jgi:UDP-N-acetylglucosamine--N-acetylmuramyl-(pentapeptide) pyrophosphoryl-undecaprenol N-acetylglucosamine transferase